MKTSLICGAALAILGLAAAPLIAQTQTTSSSSSTGYVQTSKIIGTKVKTGQGEEVGVVKDVVLDRSNGCMAYTVLSAGGGATRVTGQGKLVAVPWSVYTVSPDASYLTVNVERDRIYNAPVFEYSRIGDTAYTSQVYSTFGVSAGATFSDRNTTSTTTAGTTTNSGSANSVNNPPPPAAGPSASAAPTGAPMAAASPSATASAAASPDTKASASPKSGTKGRAKSSTSPASPRHKGDETMQGRGEEPTSISEGTEPSSGKKSSAHKSTDEESSAESAGSTSSKKSSHKKSSKEGTTETAPTPGGEQE